MITSVQTWKGGGQLTPCKPNFVIPLLRSPVSSLPATYIMYMLITSV